MKVLQILPSLELGGVERGVIDLARAMKKRGHESVVVSSGGELVAELQKMGVPHYTLPVHQKSPLSLMLVGKIARILRQERVDVIHARSRVPAWLAWFAARQAGIPFVTTCHGHYATHAASRVMGWGSRVIVISRAIGRHMIDDFHVSPDRIRLIHRGVDLAQFSFRPRSAQRPRPQFRIVNMGRLSPIKGQIEFLKAVHLLRHRLQNVEVWLVGSEGRSGKEKYTREILEVVRQLGLESCVKLLGTRRDIHEILAQADLLVLSTLVPEAFGRVLIEAGAVGTPVLSTAVGGVMDIIESGENGLLVPPGDTEAMANAMAGMLTQPDRAAQMARRLREKVEREFSLERMAEKTLEVYEECKRRRKILVIKLGAMGDLILSIPSLRMIRRRFPEATLVLLADRPLIPLVSPSPYLDELIPVDRQRLSNLSYLLKVAKRVRKEGFDLSLDLQNNKWTHLIAALAGVRERYGFRRGRFGFLLNRPDRTFEVRESPVRHQFRIVSKLGVRVFDESLELWPEEDSVRRVRDWLGITDGMAPGRFVGFVLGSSPKRPTKRWPVAHFIQLARRLKRELPCRIVLVGSPEDRGEADAFMEKAGEGVLDLVAKTSLPDLVALVRELDVIVTGDTAPLHVAMAVKTKAVALFGSTDPKRHVPPGHEVAVFYRNLPCQPCYQGTCQIEETLACLTHISADEVFEAVKKQSSLVAEVS